MKRALSLVFGPVLGVASSVVAQAIVGPGATHVDPLALAVGTFTALFTLVAGLSSRVGRLETVVLSWTRGIPRLGRKPHGRSEPRIRTRSRARPVAGAGPETAEDLR